MKLYLTIFVLSLAVSLLTVSCGVETPRFNDRENPFVIESIHRYGGDCRYVRKGFNSDFEEIFAYRSSFIAPCGLYQIGDTVKLTGE